MKKLLVLILVLSSLLLGGCCNQLINISTARERVIEYYEGGQYDKELDEILESAKKNFSKVKIESNSAVIFDVDDTALLNYEISKKLGFGYVHDTIQEWVLSAKLPAIPQMLELYNHLKNRQVKLIFLTGRKDFEYDATFKNLVEQGYTDFDTLIVRSKDEYKLPAVEFKSSVREKLTISGYKIIGSVGDQRSDLEGTFAGIVVKVPNYLYEVK